MFLARIHVSLKESVLDPQGQAVTDSLHTLGHSEVRDVRIGKYIEVRLEAADLEVARTSVRKYCETLLANPVIETFEFEVAPVAVEARS